MTPKVGQWALNENCALADLKKCKWRVNLDVGIDENFECLFFIHISKHVKYGSMGFQVFKGGIENFVQKSIYRISSYSCRGKY